MSKNFFLLPLRQISLIGAVAFLITGCSQSEVKLSGPSADMTKVSVTEAENVVVFPDDNPSIPDGEIVWKKMQCAECHGVDGKGVAGKTTVDLASKSYSDNQKPIDQYKFLTYGKEGSNHAALKDKLVRRDLWNLVFYTRSLAVKPLTQAEYEKLDIVFGANCAVCHGKQGHGDGSLNKPIPGTANLPLEPNPANFHQFNRFYDRTDKLLWEHIAYGIKWEGMPNFLGKTDKPKGVTFDEAYIDDLVRYIRRFHSSNVATLTATTATASDEKEGAKK